MSERINEANTCLFVDFFIATITLLGDLNTPATWLKVSFTDPFILLPLFPIHYLLIFHDCSIWLTPQLVNRSVNLIGQ